MKARTVYSVDWDWFTGAADVACAPKLCGWTCNRREHCPSTADRHVRPTLKDDSDTEVWRDPRQFLTEFWSFARIRKGATFVVAECHASIVRFLQPEDRIIDWDFHVDEGDLLGLHCGNWREVARKRLDVVTLNDYNPNRYQRLKVAPASLLFLCRSSPWTPREHDPSFNKFIRKLTRKSSAPQFVGTHARGLQHSYERSHD